MRGRGRSAGAVRSMLVGSLLGGVLLAAAGAVAMAQDAGAGPSPAATPAGGVAGPVDPRSTGEGPGLEAEPLIVLLGVLGLGLAAAGGTVLYVRLTRDD